jgi:gamma-glutamylaminecyclotransferase
MSDLVFVYGTLRQGERNHGLLETAKAPFLGPAILPQATLYTHGDIPFIVSSSTGGVVGEVYQVDKKLLKRLDWLEQHPDLYRRKLVKILREFQNPLEVWVYWWPRKTKGMKRIVGGDWRMR